jgi:hypothetical protein
MSLERKKPIEEMLEALAKARRAKFGDDPTMPNPMRARLHEEIARSKAEEENVESRPSWVTRFWPRITVAAALATLIVLLPAIWWNQSHPVAETANVALRDHAARAAAALNPAMSAEDTLAKAPAVSATEAAVNLADNNQIKIEPAATPIPADEASKATSRFAQAGASTELRTEPTKEFDKQIASEKIQAAPMAAPPASADSKAKSNGIAAAAPAIAQSPSTGNIGTTRQFSRQSAFQSFRNSVQPNRAANVLNTFQVQQEGDEIRVFDADGSTYTGKIEQPATSVELDSRISARRDAAGRTQKYAATSTRETESTDRQSYFRATGYNVSLKKTVLFEGDYATPATQSPGSATSNEGEQAEQSRHRARIVGTVRVNGEAPVRVDALAETPEAAGTKKNEK